MAQRSGADLRSECHHTLVLGGARSGKSVFAENYTLNLSSNSAIYLATSQIWDDEMGARVERHQSRRDDRWRTVEEPLLLVETLLRESEAGQPILVDCLTLWITNLMMAERDMGQEFERLIAVIPQLKSPVVFVSNEVGQGIVPDNKMARDFRDHAGQLHQDIAKAVDEVYFITAGLPQKLKG